MMVPELSYDSIPDSRKRKERKIFGGDTVVHEVWNEAVMFIDELAIDVSGLLIIFPREMLSTTAVLHERKKGTVLSPSKEDLRRGKEGREKGKEGG